VRVTYGGGLRWLRPEPPVRWWRRPPTGPDEVRRSLTSALWLSWTSLLVLLPATFAWVWLDRVDWLVF